MVVELQKKIDQFFFNFFDKNYSNLILKKWVYKDKTYVVDLKVCGYSIAFDLYFDGELYNIDVVNRKFHKKDDLFLEKKINIYTSRIFDDFSSSIILFMNKILKKYDYKVSVVVPTHNRENLIGKLIDSINNQTADSECFEVIFIDDCSTDSTVNVIEEKISKKINYTIIKRPIPSGNASTPRNEGVLIAKGEYIFFMDSDDYFSNQTIQDGIDCIEKEDPDVIYLKLSSLTRIVPIRPFKKGSVNNADIVKNHLLRSLTVFKFFRKKMLIDNKILFNPAIKNAEDKVFMCHVLTCANKVSILGDKDYIFSELHDGEHLSKSRFSIKDRLYIIMNGFIYIDQIGDINKKNKMFNSWLVIALEFTRAILKSSKYSKAEKELYISNIAMIVNSNSELIVQSYIYKDVHSILDFYMNRNLNEYSNILDEL